jgi:hypothetical protein
MLSICYYVIARPQFADGGNGFQTWTVAANTLNNQSRTAGMGDLPAWGLVVGPRTHHRKK